MKIANNGYTLLNKDNNMFQKMRNIINHYQRLKRQHPDTWIEFCKKQKNLQNAIHVATLSINEEGKRHPHQYRLQKINMQTFEGNLIGKIKSIKQVKHFDGLFKIVEASASKGIGELMIYDTTVRIGAFLNLSPDRIYLHAGTREGLNKLIGNFKGNTINKNQLPEPFKSSNLNCYEMEDLLCIYKARF